MLGIKKKNDQCTRKISDFFGSSKEDVNFACMYITDNDSNDSKIGISNNAMQ